MSNEEQAEALQERAAVLVEKTISMLSKLKQTNAKLFYGGIGALIVVVLAVLMRGNPEVISEAKMKELSPGQIYTLNNPNSYGDNPTSELVAVPGATAAYDTSEENDAIVCQVANGTKVKIKNFADAFGKRNLFAQVEVQSGACAGKIGWTMVVNIDD